MNRLSPLIVRRSPGRSAPLAAVADVPASNSALQAWETTGLDEADAGALIEHLKLFATFWLGGLVFFGTYLG